MKRVLAALTLGTLAWLATGIYFVQPDEIALVRRCGRLIEQPREPGPHLGFPWGIDQVQRIKPREVKRVSIGAITVGGESSGSVSLQYLTGDRNLVNVTATVHYTITSPPDYIRQQSMVDTLVATASEASLAQVLSVQPIDGVLTGGKSEAAASVREALQQALDSYQLGVSVRSVDLVGMQPPPEVADAFADVIAAQREREQSIHQARGYANQTLSQGRADAQRLEDEARAERERKVRDASGQAERFGQLFDEYQRAPALTARRIYLESMSEILARLRSKLIVDSGQPIDISVFGASGKKP